LEKYRDDRVKTRGWTEEYVMRQVLGLNSEGLFEANCMDITLLEQENYDINNEDPLPTVTPKEREVFLGNISSHINYGLLSHMKVTHIVIVHESLKPLYPKNFKYLILEANDGEKQNLLEYFKEVIQFIEDARQQNGTVLVHCTAGKSRSAAMICAYIMYKKKVTCEVAMKYMKKRRPIVEPNIGFMKQLELWHQLNFDTTQVTNDVETYVKTLTSKGKLIHNFILAARPPAPPVPVKVSSKIADRWTQKDILVVAHKAFHQKRFVNMPSADWSGKDLRGISLRNANLKFANLSNCNLQYADLENANLRHANLMNTDLSHAKIVSADLAEANCRNAVFANCYGLGERFKEKWGLTSAGVRVEEQAGLRNSLVRVESMEIKLDK